MWTIWQHYQDLILGDLEMSNARLGTYKGHSGVPLLLFLATKI